MMPMTLLATMSRPNSPLISEPVTSTMSSSTPRIALIRVKTLARTISRDAAGGAVGNVVGLAVGDPLCHFGIGQAARHASSRERSQLVGVVVLEVQRVAGRRSPWKSIRAGVFGGQREGEGVAVPVRQVERLVLRAQRQLQLAVLLGDGGRPPVVVARRRRRSRSAAWPARGWPGGCLPTSEPSGLFIGASVAGTGSPSPRAPGRTAPDP